MFHIKCAVDPLSLSIKCQLPEVRDWILILIMPRFLLSLWQISTIDRVEIEYTFAVPSLIKVNITI